MKIRPLNFWEKLADLILLPIMYLIAWCSGGFSESPQRTHRWNNSRISRNNVNILLSTFSKSVPEAMEVTRWWHRILFHIPVLGGWRCYVVVSPENPEKGWYPGWYTKGGNTGHSRILCFTPVRLLRGPKGTHFIGFDRFGNQIKVKKVGRGKIGNPCRHSSKTLL